MYLKVQSKRLGDLVPRWLAGADRCRAYYASLVSPPASNTNALSGAAEVWGERQRRKSRGAAGIYEAAFIAA